MKKNASFIIISMIVLAIILSAGCIGGQTQIVDLVELPQNTPIQTPTQTPTPEQTPTLEAAITPNPTLTETPTVKPTLNTVEYMHLLQEESKRYSEISQKIATNNELINTQYYFKDKTIYHKLGEDTYLQEVITEKIYLTADELEKLRIENQQLAEEQAKLGHTDDRGNYHPGELTPYSALELDKLKE